ncbi:hypothetical protein D3C81_910240 [compost metagenome]
MQGLLVTHHRTDEDRRADHAAELGAQQFGGVRVGKGADLQVKTIAGQAIIAGDLYRDHGGGVLLRWRSPLFDRTGAGRQGLGLGHLRLVEHHRRCLATLSPPLFRVDTLDAHPRGTGFGIAELLRRRVGQVDDAVGIERSAVVDPQDHATVVVEVGDLDVGRQRQGLVRRAHAVEVIDLAVGGVLAVELGAVPGRRALGAVVARVGDREVGLTQYGVGVGLVVAGVHGRRGIGDLVHIHVPPRRAVLVGTVDVQSGLGADSIAAFLGGGRAAGGAADQQHADSHAGQQLEGIGRDDCAHYLTPRAWTSCSES